MIRPTEGLPERENKEKENKQTNKNKEKEQEQKKETTSPTATGGFWLVPAGFWRAPKTKCKKGVKK